MVVMIALTSLTSILCICCSSQDCHRTSDRTFVPFIVPTHAQGRYQKRKQLATKILGVCDRDKKFVYFQSRWEGLATDSQVLCSVLTRSRLLVIPSGTVNVWMNFLLFTTTCLTLTLLAVKGLGEFELFAPYHDLPRIRENSIILKKHDC